MIKTANKDPCGRQQIASFWHANMYLVCSFSITVNYVNTGINSERKGKQYTLEYSSVLVRKSLTVFSSV